MNLKRLFVILDDTTIELRKGEEIEKGVQGNVEVTDIYMMPHVSEARENLYLVDVEFEMIGVDPLKAEVHRAELTHILETYPDPARLTAGPSYIEVGGVIGSQSGAFRLFALGHVLGLWKLLTPTALGVKDEELKKQMANSGMIYIFPINKEAE